MNIQSLMFENYMAYKKFSVVLSQFNILVGPNNSGKSTIIKSLQLLDSAWRSSSKRQPHYIPRIEKNGYEINENSFPFRIDNIHNEYMDVHTKIKFRFSNVGYAILTVSPKFDCFLHFETIDGVDIDNLKTIKKYFDFKIGVIPFLGPVEPKEILLTREHIQKSIHTYLSPRHFRNQWYHDDSEFDHFVELLHKTWPEMDISLPELENLKDLVMFCSENKIAREISWAGCGFQVWAQILSHLVRNKDATTLIIDEPEIYLHPDLQRKFVTVSKNLGPQVLIATHSVEIINEAEINDVLIIDKNNRSAKRLNSSRAIQNVVDLLGSVQNIHLTRLIKNKKVLFLEGNDYAIIKRMAEKIKLYDLANENGLTIVPMGGFSQWPMVKNADLLFRKILEEKIKIAMILDRDYRCDEEVESIQKKISDAVNFLHFWERKEIENYILNLNVIRRVAEFKLKRRNKMDLLEEYDEMINKSFDQMCSERIEDIVGLSQESIYTYRKKRGPLSEINKECSKEIREKMKIPEEAIKLIPGKVILSNLNTEMQKEFGFSFTNNEIMKFTRIEEIPKELIDVLNKIEEFRSA